MTSTAGRSAPTRRRLILVPAALALIAASTAACGGSDGAASSGTTSSASAGSSSSTSSMSSSAASMKTMIMIQGFAYQVPASVSPGAQVEVMNADGEAHTVTSDSAGDFDVTVDPDATVTFTAPATPGDYAFHCTYHSTMHGVLVVK